MKNEITKKIMAAGCLVAHAGWVLASGLSVVGTNSIPVGVVKDYDIASAAFTLKNKSEETIRLESFTPTCPCVQARAERDTLAPGTEAKVRVALSGSASRLGAFDHGVWVQASDGTRLKLSLTGTIVPLISGVPDAIEAIVSQDGESVFTNRYVLAATENGVSLGAPLVTTGEKLKIDLSMVTNQGERVSYDLTVVLTLTGEGKKRAAIQFPVLGKEGVETKEPIIDFSVASGNILKVVPNRLVVSDGVQLRLLFSDRKRKLDASLLTWEPRVAGLDVRCQQSRLGPGLLVTLMADAEAAAALIAAGRMEFNYSGYQSVEIPVLGK